MNPGKLYICTKQHTFADSNWQKQNGQVPGIAVALQSPVSFIYMEIYMRAAPQSEVTDLPG